jgi:hypothetical protein
VLFFTQQIGQSYKLRFVRRTAAVLTAAYVALLFFWTPTTDIGGKPAGPPATPVSSDITPFAPTKIMLALSGGGHRAMLFHAGAILRVNELGLLPQIAEISSVSGGSITAALLAARWRQLQFNERGVATNLESILLPPLLGLAGETIDRPAILGGLLTPIPATARIQHHYRDAIVGSRYRRVATTRRL